MFQGGGDRGLRPVPARDDNAFARLVYLVQDNARLFRELQGLAERARRARRYLDAPDSNSVLGHAFLDRARATHAAALLRLRANRAEACELLGPSSPHRKTSTARRAQAS